jgi:hypothetical protein
VSRTAGVIGFLFRRRAANSIKRLVSQPAQLLPVLIITPGVILGLLVAIGVLLLPSYDAAWAEESRQYFRHYADAIRSGIMVLLIGMALSLVHRALEEDLLAFRRAELDFLFPAPISLRQVLVARLANDYLFCALTTFMVVLYVVAPMRIVIPTAAGPGWALATWLGVMLFYITVMNLGRLVQAALASGRWSGLGAAKWLRLAALALGLALLGGLIWDRVQGRGPFESAVDLLSSEALYWVLLPCGVVADMFVAPLTGGVNMATSVGLLAGGAALTAVAVLAVSRPAIESSLAATERRHAVWQAFRKADASSIRAAQLAGRRVQGNPYGLPPFARGAWALAAKNLVYGVRNSPWGLVIVAMIAVAPLGVVPLIERQPHISGVLPFTPLLMLGLVFAWSQRVRLNVREEFSHLSILKSLPLAPFSILASLLVVPAVGFSLFLAAAGTTIAVSTSLVDAGHIFAVIGITPALYAALGSVHLCSGLVYPSYDPGLSKGYVADLALLPVAGLVLVVVVGAAGAGLALTGSIWPAILAGNVTGLAATAVGLGIAGFLYDRFEPAG